MENPNLLSGQNPFYLNRAFYLLFLVFLLSFQCSENPSIFEDNEISIKVDAEVTETWITLRSTPIENNATYFVSRNDSLIFEGKLTSYDTLIHDENLVSSTTYTYTAYASKSAEKSKLVAATATTMDTSSHDFSWEVFEWSGSGSSSFFDVAIINENDIWAVGEIHTEETDRWNEDSTEWLPAYNAVHWDGNEWELKWIPFNLCGSPGSTIYPRIDGVCFFDKENAIFTDGGSVTKKIGSKFYKDCSMNIWLEGAMQHIWGINEDQYLIAGSKSALGTDNVLLRYEEGTWSYLEVFTEIDINDIWGVVDEVTNEPYILLPLSFKWDIGDEKLLQLKPDNTLTEEYWPFPERRLNSVWFMDKNRIFASGAGVFSRDRINQWKEYTELPLVFTDRIRGNNITDIFIAGDFGILAHFNGKTWKEYTEFNEVDIFRGLDFKNDIAVAAGENDSKAILIVGKR